MIVVDTNFLVLMIDPNSTQNANREADRVRQFIGDMTNTGEAIVVPAPSIAELVAGRVDRIDEITEAIRNTRVMQVQEFDTVIAIETGELIATWQSRIPQDQRIPGWKAAMKYDAMVAGTALVRGASAVLTTDQGFGRYLNGSAVKIVMIENLPLPPENPQQEMSL